MYNVQCTRSWILISTLINVNFQLLWWSIRKYIICHLLRKWYANHLFPNAEFFVAAVFGGLVKALFQTLPLNHWEADTRDREKQNAVVRSNVTNQSMVIYRSHMTQSAVKLWLVCVKCKSSKFIFIKQNLSNPNTCNKRVTRCLTFVWMLSVSLFTAGSPQWREKRAEEMPNE